MCLTFMSLWSSRLAVTKLDILDMFSEIKVGIAYKVDDQVIPHFPGVYTVVKSFKPCCFTQHLHSRALYVFPQIWV